MHRVGLCQCSNKQQLGSLGRPSAPTGWRSGIDGCLARRRPSGAISGGVAFSDWSSRLVAAAPRGLSRDAGAAAHFPVSIGVRWTRVPSPLHSSRRRLRRPRRRRRPPRPPGFRRPCSTTSRSTYRQVSAAGELVRASPPPHPAATTTTTAETTATATTLLLLVGCWRPWQVVCVCRCAGVERASEGVFVVARDAIRLRSLGVGGRPSVRRVGTRNPAAESAADGRQRAQPAHQQTQ